MRSVTQTVEPKRCQGIHAARKDHSGPVRRGRYGVKKAPGGLDPNRTVGTVGPQPHNRGNGFESFEQIRADPAVDAHPPLPKVHRRDQASHKKGMGIGGQIPGKRIFRFNKNFPVRLIAILPPDLGIDADSGVFSSILQVSNFHNKHTLKPILNPFRLEQRNHAI